MTTEEWNEIYPIVSTEQKNIAIAEMLGAEVECCYHNTTSGYKMNQMVGDIMEKLRRYSNMPIGGNVRKAIATEGLVFHSDANWQFEACKFITKTYDAAWKITSKFCEIHNHNNGFDCRCEINCPENPLLDMFECLYQFSQYIKQK